jgi:hypothetical protein
MQARDNAEVGFNPAKKQRQADSLLLQFNLKGIQQ